MENKVEPTNFTPLPKVPDGPEALHDHKLSHDFSHLKIPLMIGAVILLGLGLFTIYKYSRLPEQEIAKNTPISTAPTNVVVPTSVVPTSDPFAGLEREGTQSAALGTDLPPLYSGIEWEKPKQEELIFRNENFDMIEQLGTSILSVPLETHPVGFFNYYLEALSKNKWTLLGPAGEPEDSEGSYFFKKGNNYITITYFRHAQDGTLRALIEYN